MSQEAGGDRVPRQVGELFAGFFRRETGRDLSDVERGRVESALARVASLPRNDATATGRGGEAS